MINKKGVNKFAVALIGIAIVIAIVSFFYINRGTDVVVPRSSTNSNIESSINDSIDISNFAFNPQTLTINKGDTVTWTNQDSATHTVTSDAGNELSSGNIENGHSYSHTFNSLGTFSYHCSIHTGMKGKIIVQ